MFHKFCVHTKFRVLMLISFGVYRAGGVKMHFIKWIFVRDRTAPPEVAFSLSLSSFVQSAVTAQPFPFCLRCKNTSLLLC